VLNALESLANEARQEPGVVMFQPHIDPDDSSVVFIYEQFADEEAKQVHSNSAHVARLFHQEILPHIEERNTVFYETWL
jgi:quinol monooxygenase YgiN